MDEYGNDPARTTDMQEWVLWPVDKTRYNILSCQPVHMDRNECLGVGTSGKLIRWKPTGTDEQKFSFSFSNADGWFEIYEHTFGENVAVGSNGAVLRWAATNGPDQLFKLEISRHPTGKIPELKNEKTHPPGGIPNLQKRTSPDFLPDSPKYLIGEVLTPAFFVEDVRFRSKVAQMLAKPFYRLRREQRWVNGGSKYHPGNYSRKEEFEVTIGMSETHVKSMEETTGITIKADFGVSLASKIDIPSFGAANAEVKSTFSAEFTKQLKMTTSVSTTEMKETKEKLTYEFPVGKPFYFAPYVLEDIYTVFDADNNEVKSWAMKDKRFTRESVYPSSESTSFASPN
jgi:hypothetical protein